MTDLRHFENRILEVERKMESMAIRSEEQTRQIDSTKELLNNHASTNLVQNEKIITLFKGQKEIKNDVNRCIASVNENTKKVSEISGKMSSLPWVVGIIGTVSAILGYAKEFGDLLKTFL